MGTLLPSPPWHVRGLGHIPTPQDAGASDLTLTDEQAWALGNDGVCARSVSGWGGAQAQAPRADCRHRPSPSAHCTVSFLCHTPFPQSGKGSRGTYE